MADEIRNIIKSPYKAVKIGGRKELKEPMIILLGAYSKKSVLPIQEEICENATTRGLLKIYK